MKQHLIFIFILFFLVACKRDNSSGELPDIYNYLTKEQLALTPYFTNPEFDTLVFLSDKGDTLSFAKTKVDTSYYTYNGAWGPENTQWVKNQKLTIKFSSIKGNVPYSIECALSTTGNAILTANFDGNNLPLVLSFLNSNYRGEYFFDSLKFQNREYFNSFISYSDSTKMIGFINGRYGFFHFDNKLTKTQVTLIRP